MVKRINLLNNETTNKIAAGEVVERPSSVVKELIENSIDSGAENLTIEIINGGIDLIRIVDDGNGIHPDDVKKAFLPHATSKINRIEDLYSINTFGFRGEALASIASVSKVLLKTKIKDEQFGREINISGGNINYIEDVGCNDGTVVEIRNLFYNVPARRKFLKSTARETALITDIINRLALTNHNVSFKYYQNNKQSIITFASEEVKETIKYIYGKNIYQNIIKFENTSDIITVYGYIGNVDISKGSRNYQSIFVNNRYVKNLMINKAVENAFKSFSTVNKFPFYVLFIEIFPEYLDVNVHPTKAEIKFREDKFIFSFVFNTIHETLKKYIEGKFTEHGSNFSLDATSEKLQENQRQSQVPIDFKTENDFSVKREDPLDNYSILPNNGNIEKPNEKSIIQPKGYSIDNTKSTFDVKNSSDTSSINENVAVESFSNINNNVYVKETNTLKHKNELVDKIAKFPKLNVIGQFNNTYIICEAEKELYLIDQHAAHEKILFEKFSREINERTIVAQMLLIPVVIELNEEDYSIYNENKEIFSDTGFEIEGFGDNTINIREAPIILGQTAVEELFYGILENLKKLGNGDILEIKFYVVSQLSCRAAIKANYHMSLLEMDNLIQKLRFIDSPYNCPHGRPTIIKYSLKDIEKIFKRIQ
ncbi:DNA mismatch repair endonuclease MutL [Clostridium sp. DL1XJH146]